MPEQRKYDSLEKETPLSVEEIKQAIREQVESVICFCTEEGAGNFFNTEKNSKVRFLN